MRNVALRPGTNDRCELSVNTHRAQDLADVSANGSDGDVELGCDLPGIVAVAEQVQHLALPRRQLLHLGSPPDWPNRGCGAQQVNEVRRASSPRDDRRDRDAPPPGARADRQRVRRCDATREGLTRERAARVANDGPVVGEPCEDAPARVSDRRRRRNARQLLGGRVPRHDPQLFVEDEERVT